MYLKSLILALAINGLPLLSLAAAPGGEHAQKPYTKLFPQPKANPEKSTPPSAITLLNPQALSTLTEKSVLLEWSSEARAEAYHLQVATDPNFKWLIQDQPLLKETQFKLENLPSGFIYWRVAAKRPGNMDGHTKSIFNSSSFEVQ